MSSEPNLNENSYYKNCTTYFSIIKDNAYKYLWLFVTPYCLPESERNYNNKECDRCMCVCTILCCPSKSICLIPLCPVGFFCPSYCDNKKN